MANREKRGLKLTGPALIVARVAAACLTVFALGLDMSVELPTKVIATLSEGSFFGYINNLLIALNEFHTMDHLTGLVLLVACVWLYGRFLFVRGREGERVLAGFFALTMLVSEACAAENTVTCLWSGATQLVKAALYLAGLWPLFVALIRLLAFALRRMEGLAPLREDTLWARHPFALPFLLMALCWAPFWLMKYPGGMSPEVTVQILDYLNGTMSLSHPPLTTVAYGWLYELGVRLGNANWGVLLCTLLQTLYYLAVLSYACLRMRRWGVSRWLYGAVLAVFCVSINYSGWATSHVKDVPYAISCLLMVVLLIDASLEGAAFFRRARNAVLFVLAFAGCWLWRRNGPFMAVGCALAMLCVLRPFKRAENRGALGRLAGMVCVAAVLCVGVEAGLTARYSYSPPMKREVYSHLLQMTGRVVWEHGDELPADEVAVIDRIMDYDRIAAEYDPIITDGVKFLFREDAAEEDYAAYRALVLEHFGRYPVEYVDAYLNLTYRLFDIRSDRGDYIRRREISHPYYTRSYTNLLYEQDELQGLNAAQEAVENYDFWFPDLPLVGLFSNIGLCVDVMLTLVYLALRNGRRRVLAALVPAMLTALFCLGSPLVYIRYALPITATLPLWFAAFAAHGRRSTTSIS